jgi:hypothetical protein
MTDMIPVPLYDDRGVHMVLSCGHHRRVGTYQVGFYRNRFNSGDRRVHCPECLGKQVMVDLITRLT